VTHSLIVMQKPSIAHMVIVPMDPNRNNGADEAPAIITRVFSDTLINVKILSDGPEGPEWRTSVALLEQKPERIVGTGHFAWWPPRV
jgi:methionine-rich copper-binding protein CopC